jgi:hypothetical protein
MIAKGNKNSFFRDGFLQYLKIIGTCLADFRSSQYIVAIISQCLGHLKSQHLD